MTAHDFAGDGANVQVSMAEEAGRGGSDSTFDHDPHFSSRCNTRTHFLVKQMETNQTLVRHVDLI
jgi:hypothetical protein